MDDYFRSAASPAANSVVIARLDRAIQYAAAHRSKTSASLEYWIARFRGR